MNAARLHSAKILPSLGARGLADAALGLLTALYLTAALTVSATFLLVFKDLTATLYLGYPVDHAQVQFGSGAGDGGDLSSWVGPKRIRGALEAKVGLDKAFGSINRFESFTLPVEDANSRKQPVVSGPAPGDDALPQELLRRPPPVG